MVVTRQGSSRRSCLSWAILGLLVLMVVVGVVSGGAYLYLRWAGPSNTGGPITQLRSDQVKPTLALAGLTGVADEDVVNRSLEAGELGTAYATILFSTQLSDGEHVGNLLMLGERYRAAGDQSHTASCYQQASLISTLSPMLSDSTRAYSFVQIGEGFANMGKRTEALSNYDQAFALALHSPLIRAPLKADLLGQLAVAYNTMGDREKATESSSLQTEILFSTQGSETTTESGEEQPVADFLTQIPAPTLAMVASYEERRVAAVSDLLEFLEGPSGDQAIPAELASEVAQALINEDKARSTAYQDELAAASSMVLRIGIAEAKVDWLLVKYRVALGGYGLQLVSAWSEDVSGIAAELGQARQELHGVYGEQISTFSDATAQDRAWFDILRLEIQQGELGIYPDYPAEELIPELTEVSARLVEAGDKSLHPEVVYKGDTPLFSLALTQ
jgi:tetratricopeptide (TPR) repeat protein